MSILGTQMRITGVPKQLTFKILGGQGHFHIWPPRRGCAQPVPRSSEPVSIENPPSRKRGGHQKKKPLPTKKLTTEAVCVWKNRASTLARGIEEYSCTL